MEGTEEVDNQAAAGTAAGSECYLDILIITSEGEKKLLQKLNVEVNLKHLVYQTITSPGGKLRDAILNELNKLYLQLDRDVERHFKRL